MLAGGFFGAGYYATSKALGGGQLTYDGDYAILTFTESGQFTWRAGYPTSTGSVEYLILAGGGGSSLRNTLGSGGSPDSDAEKHGSPGAGGTIRTGSMYFTSSTYSVVVGTGGLGASSPNVDGGDGGDSSVFGITASGGSGGVNFSAASVATGRGGSNADYDGSETGYQFCGKNTGGGAGSGGDAVYSSSACFGGPGNNGGPGTTWYGTTYGGGGAGSGGNAFDGGGAWSSGSDASNGTDGFGGGAGSVDFSSAARGGNGGSGVVIIRYKFQ